MSILSHIALFITYTLVAAAIFVVPDVIPAIEPVRAMIAAAFVFLCGALLHEVVARRAREDTFVRRLSAARRETADIRAEMAKSREDAKRVVQAIDSAGRTTAGGSGIDTVVAEMKVLQSLIDQLNAAAPGAADDTLEQVREALRRDRVDLYLQPIVSLPQRKQRFFECFPRIRAGDGAPIQSQQYADIAEQAGMLAAIDNLLLFRCLQIVRKTQRNKFDIGFVCNVSRRSLADSVFLSELAALVQDSPDLAARLVFEFPLDAFMAQDAASSEALGRLGQLGIRFSVDQIADLRLDVPALARLGARFAKLPASPLLSELRLPEPNTDPRALKDALDRAGIDMVVEKVESESDLIELLNLQVDFGQGFLFGEQRIAKERDAA